MSVLLRKTAGVLGVSALWGLAFAGVFDAIVLAVLATQPQMVGDGEGPLTATRVGFLVGAASGALFAALLAVTSNRRAPFEIPLVQAALAGAAAASVPPLVTPADDRMVFMLAPLGAICGLLLFALARGARGEAGWRPRLCELLSLLLASPAVPSRA